MNKKPNSQNLSANNQPSEDKDQNRLSGAPILVTGAHRSGTTWAGKMLSLTNETAYISEPLNLYHRPGVFSASVKYWYTYINEENQFTYLPAYDKLLRLDYDVSSEIRSIQSRKDWMRLGRDAWIFWSGKFQHARPLIKDPFAVFSIAWFVNCLGCQVLVTIRHPAAFASSLKRLNWPFDLADLLNQPLLMKDWLEPFRKDLEDAKNKPDDLILQASLLWRMIYQVVYQISLEIPSIHIARHEDLSFDPVGEYQELYQLFNLTFSPSIEQKIIASSSAENPKELSSDAVHSVQLNSRANLENWKNRLTKQEVDRIWQYTSDVASLFYKQKDWI